MPVSALSDCIGETQDDINALGLIAPIVGHVGDGNFHLTLLVDMDDPADVMRAKDFNRAVAFYRDTLGLSVTPAPGTDSLDRGGWVMLGDRAIIHVGHPETPYPSDARVPFDPGAGSGPVHHVAFNCLDHAGMAARLDEAGIAVDAHVVESIGLRQLFLRDPDGVLIELNFWQD